MTRDTELLLKRNARVRWLWTMFKLLNTRNKERFLNLVYQSDDRLYRRGAMGEHEYKIFTR